MKIETQVQIVITLTEEEARRVLDDPEEIQDTIRARLSTNSGVRLLPDPKGARKTRNIHRERCPKCGRMVAAWTLEKNKHRCTALDAK